MKIKIKRIYAPVRKADGTRILVDRLWPRGVSKAKAGLDDWIKDVAPSTSLRKWYHADRSKRWEGFEEKYIKELSKKRVRLGRVKSQYGKGTVTLLTAAANPEKSHASILKKILGD